MRDGKWVKMVENGQQRVAIQMCHIPNATQYGTKNLSKGAKSRVRVFAEIQNFALRARHSHCVPQKGVVGRWCVVQRGTMRYGCGQALLGIERHHAFWLCGTQA